MTEEEKNRQQHAVIESCKLRVFVMAMENFQSLMGGSRPKHSPTAFDSIINEVKDSYNPLTGGKNDE